MFSKAVPVSYGLPWETRRTVATYQLTDITILAEQYISKWLTTRNRGIRA